MEQRPGSLLEWAYSRIREYLTTGKLKPGEKIVVVQLAQGLDISPTPVKEALNRLVAEGLLDTLPRRGFVVKQLSPEEIYDIMKCRMMMEMFAVEEAVNNLPKHPEIEKKMLDALDKLESIDYRDYVQATQLEQKYHGSFIRLSGNQKLMHLYDMLFGVGFSFYVYASANHPMERHEEAQREHRDMYRALKDGNTQALEQMIKNHLEKTIELYATFAPAFAQGKKGL